MTLENNATPQVINAWSLYKRLFGYIRRYWVAILIAVIASMLYSSVDASFIYFLKPLLNEGLMAKNQNFLAWAPYIILTFFIVRAFASFFSNYYIALASRNVIMDLRKALFAHMQRLPAHYYDHCTSGKILSVLIYGVEQVANASADVLTSAVQAVFLIIGCIVVMFTISWKLTLLYFLMVPLVTLIMRIASVRVRKLGLIIQDSIAELSHRTEENIGGYRVVRAFAGQEYETQKFNLAAKINRQREMKTVVARAISVTAVQLLTAFALAITLYIATLDIGNALLSPGGFVAMITAMLGLLKPLKDLAFVQNKLFRGLAGAQSVFTLLDETIEEDQGTLPLARAQGQIKFVNVGFAYSDGKQVLENISFTINSGKVVALVGRSGSGKSTLVNLLPRFYQYTHGAIYLDDTLIEKYSLADLRQQFALVSQHVTLFHDTIANNIAYGQFAKVSQTDIIAAAKAAHALEFIEQLPNGFNSMVGENGVLLSGGQRQRIAIARAILKNAPILILDEATSSLDTESERHIQAALIELMKHRTTLVIAHRLSTVEHADKIIVLDGGKILEVGTHQELLAANQHYSHLHQLQFKDISAMSQIPHA